MTRTATRMGCSPPTRCSSPSCRMRSSLACDASCRSPTSSRKMVPPSASSNLPRRMAAAPVNAPFSWPNSSLSMSSVGMAAQLTFTNGPGRERALAMDVRRQQLLARPRLAREQHADIRSRDLRGLLDRVLERRARPDHPRRVADQLAESLVLALQVGPLERVLHDEQHAVAGERLLEEIERAAAGRVDGIADRRVPGNHHDRRCIVALSAAIAGRRCRCRRAGGRRAGTGRRGACRRSACNCRDRVADRRRCNPRLRESGAASGRCSARRPR